MTLEEYKVLREQFDNEEIYLRERDRFYAEHPDIPKLKPIERLSLVMRREFAEAIVAGTKTVEVRDADSVKWQNTLYSKEMIAYQDEHWDDGELMQLQLMDFTSIVRPVYTIHFYNYNNSWNLDVECIDNEVIVVNDANVQPLRDMYKTDEFDEILADLNADNVPDECRPCYFYFAIGQILDRRNI